MNPTVKRYLVSSVTTFVTMFIISIAAFVADAGSVEWTSAFWFAGITTGIRAAFKAVVESLASQTGE